MKMTVATAKVVGALLDSPDREISGSDIIARTGLPSGTIYPILNALVNRGDLAKYIPDGSTRKTRYLLDQAGRRALQGYMDQFTLTTPGLTSTSADYNSGERAKAVAEFLTWVEGRGIRLMQNGKGAPYGVSWIDLVGEWTSKGQP